jgi:hypothetical protein
VALKFLKSEVVILAKVEYIKKKKVSIYYYLTVKKNKKNSFSKKNHPLCFEHYPIRKTFCSFSVHRLDCWSDGKKRRVFLLFG